MTALGRTAEDGRGRAAASSPVRPSTRLRPSAARAIAALAIAAASGVVASPAHAAEPEITADTTAQFYEVRSPSGATVLARRRFLTTLGVAAYDLHDRAGAPSGEALGPDLSFRARLRYDADYGTLGPEVDAATAGAFVPGFSRGPVDLMYGYVEGRRYLGGFFGFKLGRQYVTDALGWWSFDGGSARVTTPYFVAAELYGGLEVRGGFPLSTGRFERDGIARGDRTGYDPTLWPTFQPQGVAPAFGAALESTGVSWLHGRLTYRRVQSTGASNVSMFASGLREPVAFAGSRVSQERLGWAMDASLPDVGGVKAGLVHDLYLGKLTGLYGSVDAYLSKRVTASLDFDHYRPSFDADSIWNVFMAMPMNDLAARGMWQATDRLAVAGGVHGRMFEQQTETAAPNASPSVLGNYYPDAAFSPKELVLGADASARWRFGEGSLGLRSVVDTSRTGRRLGADVFGERVLETRYVFTGRVGAWAWDDRLRDDRHAASLGWAGGVGYRFSPRSQALVEAEHNVNRLSGQRFRLMLWLTVAVTK